MSVTIKVVAQEQLLQDFAGKSLSNFVDAYIKQMLKRRRASAQYPKDKVKHWLSWLAKRMVNESQTVFLIEKMQPSWLKNRSERMFYRIGNFLMGGLIVDFSREITLVEK
jgi:hypothetical protein